MKKILITANLESFFTKFLIPQLKSFKEQEYEIHIAAQSEDIKIPYVDKKFDVCFARNFSLFKNIKSYNQMKNILKNEHYDIISCHTPFGGAITRLAYKNSHIKDTKIIYMAHGFHFYKGAPYINWLLFYNAEKYLAKYTNKIITINQDDYNIAKSKFNSDVHLVNGVGLDTSKFDFKLSDKEKDVLLQELNIPKDSFVMIYAAELLPGKRQVWLLNALKNTLNENKKFHLLLPGKDSMDGECQKLAEKLNISDQVHFLGFRKDIPKLLMISNLALSSSMREGLPVNIMEAIYCGLPIVATDCRGNRDLISNGKNGYTIPINAMELFAEKVLYFSKLKDLAKIKEENKKIISPYLLDNVLKEIMDIYK